MSIRNAAAFAMLRPIAAPKPAELFSSVHSFLGTFFLGRIHIGDALSAAALPIAGNGTVANVRSGEVPIAPPIGLC